MLGVTFLYTTTYGELAINNPLVKKLLFLTKGLYKERYIIFCISVYIFLSFMPRKRQRFIDNSSLFYYILQTYQQVTL